MDPRSSRPLSQDTQSGLASIVPVLTPTGYVAGSDFQVGTTSAVLVTVSKIEPGQGARVVLQATDVAGNAVNCDPVMPGESASAGSSAVQAGGCGSSSGTALVSALGLMLAALLVGRRRFA